MEDSSGKEPSSRSLLYILLSAFAFLSGWLSSRLRTPPDQQSIEPIRAQDNAEAQSPHRQNEAAQPLRVVVDALPSSQTPPEEREAKEKREKWYPRYGLLIQFLTLVAVIAYTIVSCNQWKTAQKQLEVSARPWIVAEVSIGSFTVQANGQETFSGVIVLRNIGHSPAVGIHSEFRLVIPSRNGNAVFTEPVRQQKQLCEPFRKVKGDDLTKMSGISILFPDQQTTPLAFGAAASKNAIDEGAYKFPDVPTENYISPVLVGCVDYRTSFDTEIHHQTGFVYDIGRYDPSAPGWELRAMKVGQSFGPKELIIERYFFGGHYAD